MLRTCPSVIHAVELDVKLPTLNFIMVMRVLAKIDYITVSEVTHQKYKCVFYMHQLHC